LPLSWTILMKAAAISTLLSTGPSTAIWAAIGHDTFLYQPKIYVGWQKLWQQTCHGLRQGYSRKFYIGGESSDKNRSCFLRLVPKISICQSFASPWHLCWLWGDPQQSSALSTRLMRQLGGRCSSYAGSIQGIIVNTAATGRGVKIKVTLNDFSFILF
jgi:hypothetical protein